MNVLVTGGCGYIGSHVCKMLSRQGHRVVVVDDHSRGSADVSAWASVHRVSTLEQDKITEILENEKIDVVMHFAAYAYVGESVQNPGLYYRNNVSGTIALLNSMAVSRVRKLVFSSTCSTYGDPGNNDPISEDKVQNPVNPYGRSKLICEQIIRDFCQVHEFTAVAFRYFNAAGADGDLQIGEDHAPETHLIPLTIRAALDSRQPLLINGNDFPTPDGTAIRDYVHVNDIAAAHIRGLEYTTTHNGFTAFNLGNQRGYSVLEIIRGVENLTGRKVSCSYGPRRPGDPACLIGDNKYALQTLGWQPEYTNLESILKTAIDWEIQKGSHAKSL